MTKDELKEKLKKATPEERTMLAEALDLDPQASKSDMLKSITSMSADLSAIKAKLGLDDDDDDDDEKKKKARKNGSKSESLFDSLFN